MTCLAAKPQACCCVCPVDLYAAFKETSEGTASCSIALSSSKDLIPAVACRLLALLPGPFRSFAPGLALGLLDPQLTFSEQESAAGVSAGYSPMRANGAAITPYDMKRLQVSLVAQKVPRAASCLLRASVLAQSAHPLDLSISAGPCINA